MTLGREETREVALHYHSPRFQRLEQFRDLVYAEVCPDGRLRGACSDDLLMVSDDLTLCMKHLRDRCRLGPPGMSIDLAKGEGGGGAAGY